MAKINIPIVGQPYKMQALQLNAQTCINWYVTMDPTGKFPHALIPTDGLETFAEVSGQKNVRGMFELNNVVYFVAGNGFYTLDSNGNTVLRGTLRTGENNVRMVPNNNQIFMSDGIVAYVYQYKASATRPIHDFFEVTNTSSNVGSPTFTGTGLNDMTSLGTYTGTTLKNYRVQIQQTGNPDIFKYSEDGGETFVLNNIITGLDQSIGAEGVQVKFNNISGHTLNDRWDFQASPTSTFFVPVVPGYQDGYGIYIKQNSDRFYISSIDDFSQVNALDFAEENIWPDYLQATVSVREELWLIGTVVTRVWYNTGAEAFPFEPRTNLAIKYGTKAPYSVSIGHDNVLFWLGNNDEGGRVAIMVAEYAPRIISTEPLHNEWNRYERISDAVGFVLQKDGHVFYHLTFPTANKTWVYDAITNMWHEKATTYTNDELKVEDKSLGRWLGNNYAYLGGKHLVGDWQSGKIYFLNNEKYTDDGRQIRRERVTRVVDKNLQRIFFHSFQVDMQNGVGLTVDTDQGYDPEVMLQVSKDDGVTWGRELWRKIGKIGEYFSRIKWNRLGRGRSFVFRLRITDPVYAVILGAVAEIEVDDT